MRNLQFLSSLLSYHLLLSSSFNFNPPPRSLQPSLSHRTPPMNLPLHRSDSHESDDSEPHNPRIGRPGIVVFSGGTAFNSAAAELASRIRPESNRDETISRSNSLSDLGAPDRRNHRRGGIKVWHVLPVTDDGGSTAEIVRILGGPAVGDIRSRLLRLAPGTTREERAVRRLLGHRLVGRGTGLTDGEIGRRAREEWLDILEGYGHALWREVSTPYRSIIRSFLVHFHSCVLQTHNGLRHGLSNPPFDFTGGSVGNFFFAGARTFFGSLPAAIFLFSKVAGIPAGSRVVPAVLTEERLVLGAELRNKMRIRGQYRISHPRPKCFDAREVFEKGQSTAGHRPVDKSGLLDSKEAISSLHTSSISRIAYLLHDPTWDSSQYDDIPPTLEWNDRHEIHPAPNPLVLDAISNANCIVYGCGSLFTSVIPCLVLDGVGEAIANHDTRHVPKILLLNGWHDRETCWSQPVGEGDELVVERMDATACVEAIVNALDQRGKSVVQNSDGEQNNNTSSGTNTSFLNSKAPPVITDYITHILYPIGTEIEIDEHSLNKLCQRRGRLHPPQNELLTPKMSNTMTTRRVKLLGVPSIPADTFSEGGGRPHHRVFDPRALVDALVDLASSGIVSRE